MSARYATAFEQIREILSARTQAQPLLEAAEIWDTLTCYPVPSVRTIQRFMDEIRRENADTFGAERHGVGRQMLGPTA